MIYQNQKYTLTLGDCNECPLFEQCGDNPELSVAILDAKDDDCCVLHAE